MMKKIEDLKYNQNYNYITYDFYEVIASMVARHMSKTKYPGISEPRHTSNQKQNKKAPTQWQKTELDIAWRADTI